jgi:uncharacterized glyoxalase superfamily protein PhnB
MTTAFIKDLLIIPIISKQCCIPEDKFCRDRWLLGVVKCLCMKKIYPITITNEIKACKDFYQTVFGFEVVFEADWYIQLLHAPSGVEVAFMRPALENQPTQLHTAYAGNGVVYSFEVDDAGAEYQKIREKTDAIFYELTTEEWGQTHFMLTDPAGVVVDVVQQAQ